MPRAERPVVVQALVIASSLALAACGDSSGPSHVSQPMDFYAAFPANTDLTQTATLSLRIVARPNVGGTVAIPGLTFSTSFTTDGSGLASVSLPSTAMLDAWDTVQARGVIVHSDDSAWVLAISDKAYSMHPAALMPATALGTDYWIMSAGAGTLEGSFLAFVGTENTTTVTITPSDSAGKRGAGKPFQVVVNRGDAYQLEATGAAGDLTGTQLQSDKPVAVFSGHMSAEIPAGIGYAGFLWTVMPPTSTVTGTDFLAWPLSPRTAYRVRVMGLQDGTNLTVTGVSGLPLTLNAGQVSEASTTTPGHIASDKPILVAQLAEGGASDGLAGADPCFTLLPPTGGFAKTFAFTTPVNQVLTRNVNIVAPAAAVGHIAHNDTVIAAGGFTAIGSTGYSGATVPLAPGVNRLTSSSAAFGALAYGWDDTTGSNGFCFAPGPTY